MFNFYLFSQSFYQADLKTIENNLKDLNDLVVEERNEEDSFFFNDSLWNIETIDGIFSEVIFSKLEDEQFKYTVLPKLFQSLSNLDNEIVSLEDFDEKHKIYNAFYGIHFRDLDLNRCITNKIEYKTYRDKYLWELTPATFWERRKLLFSKIVLCPSVENDLTKIGGTYLKQILIQLKQLDNYASTNWKSDIFNYNDVKSKTPLNISPESKKTMDQSKYKNQRMFSLPDGKRECFELHIKTGHLRFHFLPKDKNIYIGYIGKHLDTDKFN